MKLVKSLLLGSAAALVASAGAQAADLPSRKAAPVEYVKVCSAFGAGFFYIPGTDTCLKVGGMARYEWQYSEPKHGFGTRAGNGTNTTGTRAIGRIELDARNQTAYGTLRAFVRVDVARRTGVLRSGTAERFGTAFGATGAAGSGYASNAQTQVALDKAFVQWGGLIAGRAQSMFDFYAGAVELIGTTPNSSVGSTNLIGYIATFGSGFSASLSIEDPVERRQFVTSDAPAAAAARHAGVRMPDIVAALRVDQGWGSAQLSAAVHEVGINHPGVAAINDKTKYGFAVQGGLKINLPMLAPGDALWLNAAYADGAMSYVHSNWQAGALAAQSIGLVTGPGADAYFDVASGSLRTVKTWAITAAFQHFWTPQLRSAVFGGYGQVNNPAFAGGLNYRDWNYWVVGLNTVWSPVAGLDIGGEVTYQQISVRGAVNPALFPAAAPANGYRGTDNAWTGRLRIQRAF
jgi:opacity protein-like surface antigen